MHRLAGAQVVGAAPDLLDSSGQIVPSVAGSAETLAKVADGRAVSLALPADGDLLHTASKRLLRLWHLPSGGLVTEVECHQDVIDVELSADGCAVVAILAHHDGQCRELDWDYRAAGGGHPRGTLTLSAGRTGRDYCPSIVRLAVGGCLHGCLPGQPRRGCRS